MNVVILMIRFIEIMRHTNFFDNLKNYFIETSPEYLYVLSYIKTEVVTKDIKHIMDYNLIGATYTQPLCYIHEM